MTRGLIVALMALDHVRIYFSCAQFDPVDLERTTVGFFVTRWVTHLCAPGFCFIAGLGAGIFAQKAGRAEAARLLLIRGAWLIALEVLVFGFAWSFNLGWWWFGVIAGLGAAMMALGGLIYLPRSWLLCGALGFTLFHNLLWTLWGGSSGNVATMLYSGGLASLPLAGQRIVLYPLLPWLALMALGYASTRWLAEQSPAANRRLLSAALIAIAAFVLCRWLGFGQPAGGGFAAEGDVSRDILPFFNIEKYPASLQFSLITIGLCLLFLWTIRRFGLAQSELFRPLLTFGQVPFFFYLLHLFAIHGAALLIAMVLGWRTDYLFWEGVGPNLVPPEGYGFGLPGIYLAWFAVLAALLVPCKYFAGFKRNTDRWWLKLL